MADSQLCRPLPVTPRQLSSARPGLPRGSQALQSPARSGSVCVPVVALLLCPPHSLAVRVACPARRELQEESGLTVEALHKVGHIVFEFVGEPELMDVHIFCTDSVQGTPVESDGESWSPSLLPTPAGEGKPGPGPRGRHCTST